MPLGFEACTAEALCNLKVNKSKEAIINKLDESIGIIFQAAQKKNPNVNKENFGVPGCCWSPSVILRTLKSEGKPFVFLKVPRDKWAKALLLETKRSFFIEGILNRVYHGRVGKKKKEVDISQLWSPEIKADGNWRHSTSVINGRVWDNTWVHQETTKNARTMPVKYLWLNSATGKPDPNKGFFKDIYNVHEFSFNDPHYVSMLK